MLNKLFGKPEEKFYIQLPDATPSEAIAPRITEKTEAVAEKTAPTPAPAPVAATPSEPATATPSEPAIATPSEPATATPSEPATATPSEPAAPTTATNNTSSSPRELIAAAVKVAVQKVAEVEEDTDDQATVVPTKTYAELHLFNAGNKMSRRRPSGSMSTFLGMARK